MSQCSSSASELESEKRCQVKTETNEEVTCLLLQLDPCILSFLCFKGSGFIHKFLLCVLGLFNELIPETVTFWVTLLSSSKVYYIFRNIRLFSNVTSPH